MEFLIVYLTALLVPGLTLAHIVGFEKGRTCAGIGLSVGVLVVGFAAARIVGLEASGFGYLMLAVYGGLAVWVLAVWRNNGMGRPRIRIEAVHIVPVAVLSGVLGYVAWVGPYLEIPADAWWHIGRINEAGEGLRNGVIGRLKAPGELLDKDNYYWHVITAYFIHLAGLDLERSLSYLAVANTALFCIGVYSFSLVVFDKLEVDVWKRHLISGVAVVFFVTHFGISIFSYVRYYVFSPGFVNFIVYLTALVCLFEFLWRRDRSYRFVSVGMLLLLVAAMVHFQEAIFIVVMSGATLLVTAIGYVAIRFVERGELEKEARSAGRRSLFLFMALACGYVVAHIWAYWTIERENPMAHGFLMADIRNYLPFLQNLYVLRPTGQFYQVITVWGVLVYTVFLLRRKGFFLSPYLAAGMAIPIVTVFNPVFTDFFLRFAGPQVLWRMCYMLPLPFVGGYFFVRGAEKIVAGRGLGVRLTGFTVVVGLTVLLLPINTTYFVAPHSKVYMLAPVEESNSHRLWYDLFVFLQDRERSGIITDRVTGYVINGLTEHKYRGYKFYEQYASHINRQSYEDDEFQANDGWKRLVKYHAFETKKPWLVVINRRDGAMSEVGRRGRHWPEDIMKVSRQYSDAFIEYVERRPDMFEEIWQRDRIVVYQVLE